MEKLSDEELNEVASKAINAANKVLFDAGITDRLVAQLGFIEASAAKKINTKSNNMLLDIIGIWGCPCWDCTQGPGLCICNGPACRQFPP